jgi:hypothetical protein
MSEKAVEKLRRKKNDLIRKVMLEGVPEAQVRQEIEALRKTIREALR